MRTSRSRSGSSTATSSSIEPALTVRVAALGDLHADLGAPASDRLVRALAHAAERADLLVLAGDLTARGLPSQAAIVADACRPLGVPVVAVLGNHDLEQGRAGDVVAALSAGGVAVLHGDHRVLELAGTEVGVAGTTGTGAGFPGAELPATVAARRRERARAEVARLDAGLRAIAACAVRIAVLHYSPTVETLVGERRRIWGYLGCDALAGPIREHAPHVVVHAHAHAGTFRGRVGPVSVFNVSSGVVPGDFCLLDVGVAG